MHPIMTTKEAAELLGIKTELVRRWCREGHLPAVQLGREYRISRAALIDWWDEKGGGRLDFDSFYSVQKDEKNTVEVVKNDDKNAEANAKNDKQKVNKTDEKENMKQRAIERRIIRGGL